MKILVVVMPHEREDAIEAYSSKLTDEQVQEIRDAEPQTEVHIEFDEDTVELRFKEEAEDS